MPLLVRPRVQQNYDVNGEWATPGPPGIGDGKRWTLGGTAGNSTGTNSGTSPRINLQPERLQVLVTQLYALERVVGDWTVIQVPNTRGLASCAHGRPFDPSPVKPAHCGACPNPAP